MAQGQKLDRLRSAASRFTLLLAVLAVSLPAACGGAEPAAAPAQEPTESVEAQPSPPAEAPPPTESTAPGDTGVAEAALPPAVAETRDAIISAAHARDYAALEALLDPATFSYSFGESGDPISYWRGLKDEGEVPILGDILPTVFSMHVAKTDDVCVWPAAHAKDPSACTENDLADLRLLYSDDDIRSFEEIGGYLGYRVGIREDGTWLYFIAGDYRRAPTPTPYAARCPARGFVNP